jgi:hypothetical protein
VGLNSLKSLNLTNGYPNKNKKNKKKNNNNNNNNKVKSKPLELRSRVKIFLPYKILKLPNYMGCLMEFYTSLTLFYMKMSFKILKFSNRPLVFFPSNLL